MEHLNHKTNIKESYVMGSFNHSYLQARLASLFNNMEQYTALTDLSMDINGAEYRADVCIYPKRGRSKPQDILRISEMPLLAVEILSPKQGTYDIIEKFKVYFEADIRSCWLVSPATDTITVYSAMDDFKNYAADFNQELKDNALETSISVEELFD